MTIEVLSQIATASMLLFVVTGMLAVGVNLTVEQITDPLRNVRLILLVLLTNFILMPMAAILLAATLQLAQPLREGLLLLGTAAGAPFLPKLAELAKGEIAFAVATMVLLMVVTLGYLPIVLPLLLSGVTVEPGKIAGSLIVLMLLPLASGLFLKARHSQIALRLKPVLDRLSNIALLIFLLSVSLANVNKFVDVFGTRGILAGILFNAVGLGIGWVLGGPEVRSVLALGTGQRNIAAALLVANEDFRDPEVGVMVIVVALIGPLMILPGAFFLANSKLSGTGDISGVRASKLSAKDEPPTP
jgi:BASS family bile acid:Na+ symporter